jgi:hypothetical protein
MYPVTVKVKSVAGVHTFPTQKKNILNIKHAKMIVCVCVCVYKNVARGYQQSKYMEQDSGNNYDNLYWQNHLK